ncbi:Grainyhead-like protein 2 [Penicillium rolfsii]|nr:Grainyhead-like protein 2 [Penicillium rolfsii]
MTSVFGTAGGIDTGGHTSFDESTVPSSTDVFLAQNLPPESQRFQSYQQGMDFSVDDFDRSISPKNDFGNESEQFTQGWLPTSQPDWKIDYGSFDYPLLSHQPNHTALLMNSLAYQPSQIVRCDSGYETWDEPPRPLLSQDGFSGRPSSTSLVKPRSPQLSTAGMGMPPIERERFRFHTCLQASTAMINDPKEAPESYLNKGQIYHLSLVDTAPPSSTTEATRYRTYIRVSFKEQEQRVNAEFYWRLWKESRGLTESENKDSELRAVEYTGQNGPQMQVDEEFLDGFTVSWTIDPGTGANRCTIPVRFNFLSTDFTLAKGVKGISVRLCAKTEQLNNLETPYEPEICFCNVKVFRDHGAERKLFNDITNVQRRIAKLTEQVGKASLHEPPKKRKRGSVAAKSIGDLKGFDLSLTHEHGLSMDIAGVPAAEKLQSRLVNLRNMLFSTSSESVLSLRGGKEDDPEMHITRLPSTASSGLRNLATQRGSTASLDESMGAVRLGSDGMDTAQDGSSVASVKGSGLRPSPMPVACFFIYRAGNWSTWDRCYRAIYLRERTAHDLVQRICEKCGVDASEIARILHTNQAGLEILVDDDFVRQMTEGQDMVVRIEELPLEDGCAGSLPSAHLGIWLEY